MLNRRNFIRQTSLASFGALALPGLPRLFHPAKALPAPGLQLFTYFNSIDNDVKGTLQNIAASGYRNIESAFSKKGGYYGMKPREFAAMVEGLGMKWRSHHVLGAPFKLPAGAKMPAGADGKPIVIPPMKNLRDNFQELVDEAAEGKISWLVCANTPIGSLEEIRSSIAVLNKTAEAAHKAGLNFAYHNHDAEFRKVEGEVPYELLLKETNPDLVKMELDIAWSIKGGADPLSLFKNHPGRFPLWHLKDLDAGRNTVLPLGKGTIDFLPFFKARSTAGLQYYFVEHDMPKDADASIKESMNYLKKVKS